MARILGNWNAAISGLWDASGMRVRKTATSRISSTWWWQTRCSRSQPGICCSWEHTPPLDPIFVASVSKHRDSLLWYDGMEAVCCRLYFAATNERNCEVFSKPSPEMRIGSWSVIPSWGGGHEFSIPVECKHYIRKIFSFSSPAFSWWWCLHCWLIVLSLNNNFPVFATSCAAWWSLMLV